MMQTQVDYFYKQLCVRRRMLRVNNFWLRINIPKTVNLPGATTGIRQLATGEDLYLEPANSTNRQQ